MLHDGQAIRVAILGGSRIPFCRSHSAYRKCSNKDLMTAALDGLVTRHDLRGLKLGEVALALGGQDDLLHPGTARREDGRS